jgi:hypothetical protein
MFNFMIVAVGIFANAIVAAISSGLPPVAIALCVTLAVWSFFYIMLDTRNQELVQRGEYFLANIESKHIFREREVIELQPGEKPRLGILYDDLIKTASKQGEARTKVWRENVTHGKHRFWLRFVAFFFIVASLVAIVLILIYRQQIRDLRPRSKTSTEVTCPFGDSSPGNRLAVGKLRGANHALA